MTCPDCIKLRKAIEEALNWMDSISETQGREFYKAFDILIKALGGEKP